MWRLNFRVRLTDLHRLLFTWKLKHLLGVPALIGRGLKESAVFSGSIVKFRSSYEQGCPEGMTSPRVGKEESMSSDYFAGWRPDQEGYDSW